MLKVFGFFCSLHKPICSLTLQAFGWVAAFCVIASAQIVHYPKPEGVVFGLPHVSIILKSLSHQQRKSLTLAIDGRAISDNAFSICRICAGDKPTVIAAKAKWTITDGIHRLQAKVNGEIVDDFRYIVDTSVPSLMGLSGTIAFPDAHVAIVKSWRIGLSQFSRSKHNQVWFSLTGGKSLPFEIAIEQTLDGDDAFSWKMSIVRSNHLGLSIGQRNGDKFAVLGYRTQPNYLSLSVGLGEGSMPSSWLGLSYSLSHLTQKLKPSEGLKDFFAVLDLVRFQFEMDNKRRLNFGAWLCHPYGWRVGIHQVKVRDRERVWVGLISFSGQW
ncbi:MAG: hypothetical protein NZ805_03235 [Armatimonadetes bacterium]|nr:hypothetical protein [Armatimonadota bacterium]MDW8027358.1 hypothetical protein [Armatimonadota bacterium]